MRKKLLLINPINLRRRGSNINPIVRCPPLGLGIVAALTPDDWSVKIIDENFERFKYEEADLVGFNASTVFATRAYEIAALYRERGIHTVIGGIHASMMPDEAMEYVDTVVVGEAENSWPRFIEDFLNGTPQRLYKKEGKEPAPIVGARHDLFHPSYVLGSLETARGCPMDCHFCSVTAFHGRSYRQRDVEEVLDELETITQNTVYFVDDNLFGHGKNAKERALELFKGIIKRGIKKDWYTQVALNFAEDDTVLEYAAKSGCKMVLIGVEAESKTALTDIGKNLNIKKLGGYSEAFRRIKRHGIAVLGSFIFGMEHDTPESLAERTEYILNSEVDAMQISLMTPLPGTRLYKDIEAEGRLVYTDYPNDWPRYDLTEIVFEPKLMTPEELRNGITKAFSTLYSPMSLGKKYMQTLAGSGNPNTAAWAYFTNVNNAATGVQVAQERSLFTGIENMMAGGPQPLGHAAWAPFKKP